MGYFLNLFMKVLTTQVAKLINAVVVVAELRKLAFGFVVRY